MVLLVFVGEISFHNQLLAQGLALIKYVLTDF